MDMKALMLLLLTFGLAVPGARAEQPSVGETENSAPLVPLLSFPAAKKGEVKCRLENPVVLVAYDDAVDPASLKATLDGRDVSSAFHPAEGSERVRLPLHGGENLLEIEVARKVPTEGPPLSTMESLPRLHQLKIIGMAREGADFNAKVFRTTLTPDQMRALKRGEAVDLGNGLPPLRIPKHK